MTKDYIYITTPYLIIDNTMVEALCSAATSGVDVRIITPAIPDKKSIHFTSRSYYDILIKNGSFVFRSFTIYNAFKRIVISVDDSSFFKSV